LFRDEVTIEVEGGKGGDGLVSFRRERFVPRGGPDGGDGGRGGDVVLLASTHVNSLLHIRRRRYAARGGTPGGPRNAAGKDAEELVLEVPPGTQVLDAERGNLLRDLSEAGQRLVVARGGRGGWGNTRFASALDHAPRKAVKGALGEHRSIRLELKLIAEVGLVGLPNAGKSSFLAAVSRARPKVAPYPFTTLAPEVGIAAVGEYDGICIADLPGLIHGAADGAGLGNRFLRHIERCPMLLQLVDCSAGASDPPVQAWRTVREELRRRSPELAARPHWIVATKCEDEEAEKNADELERAAGCRVWRISSVTRRGLEDLLRELHRTLRLEQA
jgi:GTP-binding protein